MAVATFVGAISGLVPPVHLVLLAAAGFGAGLLVAAGRGATQVGVNATIALLVFGRLTGTPATAALHATWVLAGGLFQFALAIAARSQRPLRSQRAALASAYEALAAAAADEGPPPISVAEAAATAREAIGPWLQGERPATSRSTLRGLADELDRIRHEFHALLFQQEQLSPERRGAIRAALTEAAGALGEIAAAIREGRTPAGVEPAAGRLTALADRLAPQAGQPVRASRAHRWSAVRGTAVRERAHCGAGGPVAGCEPDDDGTRWRPQDQHPDHGGERGRCGHRPAGRAAVGAATRARGVVAVVARVPARGQAGCRDPARRTDRGLPALAARLLAAGHGPDRAEARLRRHDQPRRGQDHRHRDRRADGRRDRGARASERNRADHPDRRLYLARLHRVRGELRDLRDLPDRVRDPAHLGGPEQRHRHRREPRLRHFDRRHAGDPGLPGLADLGGQDAPGSGRRPVRGDQALPRRGPRAATSIP